MSNDEIRTIFAAIQGASDKLQLSVASAMYAIENAGPSPKPITEEEFNLMWSEALGRQTEGHAGRIQAMHFMRLVEQHYGIK